MASAGLLGSLGSLLLIATTDLYFWFFDNIMTGLPGIRLLLLLVAPGIVLGSGAAWLFWRRKGEPAPALR